MEENSENTSPHAAAGASLANGSYSGGGDSQSNNSANGSNGGLSNNTMSNGTTSANGARPNGSLPATNGATGTAGSASVNGSAAAATNGAGAGNSTIGGKAFNTATAKRSRLVGAPPPVYSPLGASSPSMSSNAPSFQASSGSASSSAATTPSASPQSSNAHLPSTNSYSAPQSLQQQQQTSQLYSNQNNASGSSTSQMYPALHLHPLNDTFIPKQISLYPPGPHNRIKIGRQTNAKTVPAPNNGYFDSKVLSRMHAEVWAEGNKVYIKDVKSSNGTFINGERLSPEAVESDIFELHNNDMVEFGIDITSEDAKTIVHHKVAARCFLVMNADDAVAASRNFANYYRDLGDSPMHRRPGMGPNKGGMSTSGMNIDQVLSRLQTELQKSRETGADLGTLTNTIGEIHETLGGNLPVPPVPAYRVPPYVPGAANAPPAPPQVSQQSQAQTQQLLTSLQTQLQETQNALNGHVERIRNLEGLLEEQERMRTELKEVKERMEEARSEWERLREDRSREAIESSEADSDSDEKEDLQDDEVDDDGTRTIRLDEEEAASLTRGDAHEVPLSIYASGDNNNKQEDSATSSLTRDIAATQARLEAENETLSQRMQSLSNELSAAAQLSASLKSQYNEAAETIRGLEMKVNTLEQALQTQRASSDPGERAMPSSIDSVTGGESSKNGGRDDILREVESRFTNWKKSFEEAVQKEREGWEEEREQLRITLSEWEKRSESLRHSQGVSSSGGRRKRRSKASTVSTSSEESSDSQEDSQEEEGFVSPVTEEEAQSPAQFDDDSSAADGVTQPKRPRSRRRNYRSGEAAKAAKRAAARAEAAQASDSSKSPSKEGGGQSLRRRQSWIPFSQSGSEKTDAANADKRDGGKTSDKKQHQRGREASNVLEHPALPIVSVAGALVIGYLAYSAIIQQQK
ncbi:hypothetical protein P389DRAFT_92646 [Cystobasidium minutum MCA 4210]|uniref:uncharacterized protein n=1 Tax=Cystobasidium minutum MCA 4210 TaxID=1397322 RepID=UPI0034CFAB99|eukprot:jgi/Rhomi1/92646/CE92645_2234